MSIAGYFTAEVDMEIVYTMPRRQLETVRRSMRRQRKRLLDHVAAMQLTRWR